MRRAKLNIAWKCVQVVFVEDETELGDVYMHSSDELLYFLGICWECAGHDDHCSIDEQPIHTVAMHHSLPVIEERQLYFEVHHFVLETFLSD